MCECVTLVHSGVCTSVYKWVYINQQPLKWEVKIRPVFYVSSISLWLQTICCKVRFTYRHLTHSPSPAFCIWLVISCHFFVFVFLYFYTKIRIHTFAHVWKTIHSKCAHSIKRSTFYYKTSKLDLCWTSSVKKNRLPFRKWGQFTPVLPRAAETLHFSAAAQIIGRG